MQLNFTGRLYKSKFPSGRQFLRIAEGVEIKESGVFPVRMSYSTMETGSIGGMKFSFKVGGINPSVFLGFLHSDRVNGKYTKAQKRFVKIEKKLERFTDECEKELFEKYLKVEFDQAAFNEAIITYCQSIIKTK